MKKYTPVIVFMIGLLVCYLVGSFVAASFNIKEWDGLWRGMVGVCGLLFSALAAAFSADIDL